MATIADANAEDPLGWMGASLGAAHDESIWLQAENRDMPRIKLPNVPAIDNFT
jgi:hypothetical protein